MGPNLKFIFQLAIFLIALVIFVGIYVLKRGAPIKWTSEPANRYFRWSLAVSILVVLMALVITIILTN